MDEDVIPFTSSSCFRVLFIITELNEGGAENALWEVVRRLHEDGLEVTVVALHDSDGAAGQRLREAGIRVEDMSLRHPWQIWRIFRLRRVIKKFDPQLVHSWLFHANFITRFVLPLKTPLVCSLRVCEPRQSHILLDRWTRKRVCRYICNSEDVAEFAFTRLAVPEQYCEVIRNGVDVGFYGEGRRDRSNDKVLAGLTIARIVPQKGIDILVQALARLPEEIDWQWTFVGDNPDPDYHKKVEDLAEAKGIASRITWKGAVARNEILPYYQRATVFVLPSRWEGQPNVVLEAMAAGLPVLASPLKGITELLEQEPGCIIPVSANRPDIWAQVLTDTWKNNDRRERALRGGLRLTERRDWAETADLHLQVYKTCLQRGSLLLRQ